MTKPITRKNDEELENVDGEDENDAPSQAPTPRGRQTGAVKSTAVRQPFNNSGVTDKQELTLTEDAQRTKEFMDKQPKRSYYIPLNFGEKKGAEETVTVNGYKLTIKKGVRVMIPEPMAQDLDRLLGIQDEVALDKRVDMADKDVLDALTA